jgi:hypothetical protein
MRGEGAGSRPVGQTAFPQRYPVIRGERSIILIAPILKANSFVRVIWPPGARNREGSRMSRGLQVFRQTDVTKAIKAAQNADLDVQRFEIDRSGKIVVFAGRAAAPIGLPPGTEPKEWDNVG